MKITLDDTTIIPFPNEAVWAIFHTKFSKPLVEITSRYSITVADAEDAVEEAFYKLMHKKDPDAWGDKMPQTEKSWFWALYWQARSYLSHLKDRSEVHARYVQLIAPELKEAFASGHQGEEMDGDILARALERALKTLKSEQDISRRNLEIYVSRMMYGVAAKEVAKKYNIKANNVDQITWRVGRLIRKYGPRHFEAALRREGYGYAA